MPTTASSCRTVSGCCRSSTSPARTTTPTSPIAALDVQGLRTTDNNRTFPIVAPLVEGRYDVPFDILGGHLRLIGNAVLLNFDELPVVPDRVRL